MYIYLDKLHIKHWVRIKANLVNDFYDNPNRKVDLKDLRMYYVTYSNSVHYNAIVSKDYSVYNQYIQTCVQPEHSDHKFIKLLEDWDINKMGKILISKEFNLLCVIDGVHRLSIYAHLNNPIRIPITSVDIAYTKEDCEKIAEALVKTTGVSHYNGWSNRTMYGYHSFSLFNINLVGQRFPKIRLDLMRKHYNFDNKYLIDIGCNTGGMLFHCLEIKKGLGVDFDANCIDAANVIKDTMKIFDDLTFIKRDLDNDPQTAIFEDGPADVVFLLSLGSWVKKWRDLYTLVIKNAKTIFLEINNVDEGKAQIEHFKSAGCALELVSNDSSDDITNNFGRKTYMITTP
jgi:hypothetical protein